MIEPHRATAEGHGLFTWLVRSLLAMPLHSTVIQLLVNQRDNSNGHYFTVAVITVTLNSKDNAAVIPILKKVKTQKSPLIPSFLATAEHSTAQHSQKT